MIAVAILWALCAFACAALAPRKGRQPLALFCYGLVLGPIAVGWILLVEPIRFGGPPEGRG